VTCAGSYRTRSSDDGPCGASQPYPYATNFPLSLLPQNPAPNPYQERRLPTPIAIACQPVRPDEACPETLDLIAYWDGRRVSPALPARRDLNVLDLRPWLGRASLYEARADGDFFCRLRGSTMCTVPVPGHASDGILSLPSG